MLVDADAIQELENLYGFTMHPASQESPCFAASFDDAVRGLEDDVRDAFILTELRGLTAREAAGVLDTSYRTVHRRAEIARQFIREELR